MKKHFGELLAAGLLAAVALTGMIGGTPAAYAWTDVLVRVDTVMPSVVFVATGATTAGLTSGSGGTRIDNWNKGSQGTSSQVLLSGRTALCCVNISTFAASCYVGWSNGVSSFTVSASGGGPVTSFAEMGEKLDQGDKTCRAADRSLAVWAIAADNAGTTGVALSCEQLGKKNP